MEIVREGDMTLCEKNKRCILQFTCIYCGCVFDAGRDEYEDNQYDGVYCYCHVVKAWRIR